MEAIQTEAQPANAQPGTIPTADPKTNAVDSKSTPPSREELRQQAIADFLPDRLNKVDTDGKETGKEEKKEVSQSAESPEAAKTEEAKEETPKEDNLSKKFAAIARRDKLIREKEKHFSEIDKENKKLRSIFENAKADPDSFLQAGGIDYDYLTNHLLNGKKTPENVQFDKLGDEVREIRSELERSKIEAERSKYEAIESGFKSDLAQLAIQNKDKYAMVLEEPNGVELTYEIIKHYYRETNEILPQEKALEAAETHLRTEAQSKISKYRNIPFLQAMFAEQKKDAAGPNGSKEPPKTKTLTNQAPVSTPSDKKKMTEAEKVAYCASLIRSS